jgi:hypothetical protein
MLVVVKRFGVDAIFTGGRTLFGKNGVNQAFRNGPIFPLSRDAKLVKGKPG